MACGTPAAAHAALVPILGAASYSATTSSLYCAVNVRRRAFWGTSGSGRSHPGNVLFLPGDRIGFVDFGMFGRLDPSERRRMALLFWALVDGDYEAVGGQLLGMSEFLPGADPASFRAALADTVEDWFGGRAADFSIARLLLSDLALGARHGIVTGGNVLLMADSDGTQIWDQPRRASAASGGRRRPGVDQVLAVARLLGKILERPGVLAAPAGGDGH